MKGLFLTLAILLSSSLTFANDWRLECDSVIDADHPNIIRTIKEVGDNFEMRTSRLKDDGSYSQVLITTMYVHNTKMDKKGGLIFYGLAETQRQVDVFHKENFRFAVFPESDTDVNATLVLSHPSYKQDKKYSFACELNEEY